MTFFIAASTIALAGLAAFLVSWRRDARAKQRAEDERVTTGIDILKAIPPATNLAAPPPAVNATQPAAASPVTGTPSTPVPAGPASPPPPRIHIARSPLLPHRSHAAAPDSIFEPVTLALPRPRWSTPTPRRPLLVAPTAERRRELVNA